MSDLKAIVERIEQLESEKKETTDQITEVYKEAKEKGFDGTIIRAIIKDRSIPEPKKQEFDVLFTTYMNEVNK